MKNYTRRNFFILFIGIAIIEFTIAYFFTDTFVRPLLGDVFVSMWVYSLVRVITPWSRLKSAVVVWIFTLLVEISQALSLLSYLGMENNSVARLVLGTDFDWRDILAYTIGLLIIYLVDPFIQNLGKKTR